ncbi:tetratricopeptide repeat protein [Litoribrevibacter albus]|uniref:Tetratricopeptide repeat protein n=1 Tax=Litoribrevibacter albus TaxID=1473156 RepID=A0AA37W8D8_9GAMM|nr:tetratricopeptide repeat protein [Litoribrevibacter albus]GLQ31361.1 hypothetical protein GCM10007876_18400 [Litoribrevibacter albus]
MFSLIILLSGCATQGTQQSSPLSTMDKDSPEYYVASGYSFLSNRSTKKAIKEFDKAIDLCQKQHKDREEVIYASRSPVETLYYMMKAAAEQKSAVAVAQTCADALYFKGYAVLDFGELELAQNLLDQALSMSPANAMYLSEVGHIHHIKKSWKEALDVFIKAEDAAETYSPDQVKQKELTRAKRGIGFSLIELGRLDEAEVKFNECLEINPNDKTAKHELEYIKRLRTNVQGDS